MISNITAAFARLKEEGLKLVGIGPEGEEASSILTFRSTHLPSRHL